ncbi:STAS domain-containing protein [Litoribacter ruber]|uniref:Anti-sigma factor antagonist n=1 Tax=Litoribacter ruber TaxID=702568 RepID=A0AAP2CJ98_9BACT|nr:MULTISPECIES: STAS domain-containing protein [Litoribacter]MBS9524231.1 STAS domain-containing protein [Litoribacter alkaliphilus]MBT0809971.1 STAS domain-containing protein [Litoribacter ruber]
MLQIDKIQEDEHVILTLSGEVDASNSVDLDNALQAVMEPNKKILLDGSNLQYISSAGLGVFMSYLEEFEAQNIQFVIFGLNQKVYNVFHILGLDQLIIIQTTKEKALQEFYEA